MVVAPESDRKELFLPRKRAFEEPVMEFSLGYFLAVFVGYAASIGVWFGVTKGFPRLWAPKEKILFARPKAELGWALLAAVLVALINVVYNLGWLFPLPEDTWLADLVFLVILAIIWSPVFITLAVRRQGLETCLFSLRGLFKKLIWGIAGSVVGMATYLLIRGRSGDLELVATALWSWDAVPAIQSVVQFFGVGFLLTRTVGATGRLYGILICGVLYGVVKYPLYLTHYGMSFGEATGMIAFSACVACAVIYMTLDRRDLLVPAIIHVFMDDIQNF